MIPTITYIPNKLKESPLYIKITDLLDDVQTQNDTDFKDTFNKYRDIEDINIEGVKLIIKEFGYQYIVDVLALTDTQLVSMLGFLSLVHILKGHKSGVELVLRLLGYDYTIEEWWEDPTNIKGFGYNYGFDYGQKDLAPGESIITLLDSDVSSDIIARIQIFLDNYVFYNIVTILTL